MSYGLLQKTCREPLLGFHVWCQSYESTKDHPTTVLCRMIFRGRIVPENPIFRQLLYMLVVFLLEWMTSTSPRPAWI